LERREAGYSELLTGYWLCEDCWSKDMRLPQERYPADFYLYTDSNAAVVGLAGDTLKRLHKKERSLGFMIEEGGQLISHPSSMEAWRQSYDEKKSRERRKQIENYQGWIRTDSGSGSAINSR
jgi:hypothetical protein